MFSLQQNWRRGQNRFCLEARGEEGEMAQTMYAHMNKWINNNNNKNAGSYKQTERK
jgi:hypothetical protein